MIFQNLHLLYVLHIYDNNCYKIKKYFKAIQPLTFIIKVKSDARLTVRKI